MNARLQVNEVMTRKILGVGLEDSVRKAFSIMSEKRIRHLPVTDNYGSVIGILSDRDLYRAMTPQPVHTFDDEPFNFDSSLKVKDFMSWPALSVGENESLPQVAERFIREKISAFLVTNPKGLYVGIITTDDLLRVLAAQEVQKQPQVRLLMNQYWDHVDLG